VRVSTRRFGRVGLATGIAALRAIFAGQFRSTVTRRLAATPLASHAHAIAAELGSPGSGGAQSGLTAATRPPARKYRDAR
jgi:hypothetical protein